MSLIVARRGERVTGSLAGKPFNILYDEDVYSELKVLSGRIDSAESKKEYDTLVESTKSLLEVDFNIEVAAANGYLKYLPNKGTYHLVLNKGTKKEMISSIAIPELLSSMIIESYEEGNDYMPLILAWARFIAPDERGKTKTDEDVKFFASYLAAEFVDQDKVEKLMEEEGLTLEVATQMATYQDIAVTTYGILATYKVADRITKIWKLEKDKDGNTQKVQVDAFPGKETIDPLTGEVTKEEGKPEYLEELMFTPSIHKNGHKFYSGDKLGYVYEIGKEAVLPEEAPRNHSNSFGGGGLYGGGNMYIQGFHHEGVNDVLTCFIDPAEIISFQSEGHALRTNRMFVNGTTTVEGALSGMYFVSDYAKESDARLKKRIEAAVKATAAKVDEHKAKTAEGDAVAGFITGK